MILQGFCGGLGTVRSRNQNAEHTINFYPASAPGLPKAQPRLQYTPRVEPFTAAGNGPIRALFAQDGRCFAVSSDSFYEVFANGTVVRYGTAVADADPATIIANSNVPTSITGKQLGITSGGKFYVFNMTTNIIAEVTTGWEPVITCAFVDNYALVLKADSNVVGFSAPADFSSWTGSDNIVISIASDQIVTMLASHRELFLLGSQTGAVYADVGDADNPFQPIPGVSIAQGSGAPFGAVNLDNTIYFLGSNENGTRMVYRFKGYTPERVSNPAVEYILNNYPYVWDAVAWCYQEEGHAFYVLFLPTPPDPTQPIRHTFLVYDVSTDQWHERALWNPPWFPGSGSRWQPHIGRCHCFAFGKHLIGDRQGPGIYWQTLTPDVNGRVIDRIVVT